MVDPGSLPLVATWTSWLLTYLLHSTVLIGSTWIVLRVTRLRPATRDVLWKTALIGGIVTATATTLSMQPGGTLSNPAAAGEVIAAHTGVTGSTRAPAGSWVPERAPVSTIAIRAQLVDPSPECREAVRAGGPGDPGWLARLEDTCASSAGGTWWPLGLLGLWLSGAVVGVTSLGLRRRALVPVYDSLRECGPEARHLLDSLIEDTSGSTRLPRVRLRASSLVGTPCVLPGNTLVLSDRSERELTEAELRAVLAHELAHVARRDVLWSGFARMIASVLWLQPLNRWVCDRLSHSSELVCDEWAVGVTGERYGLASSISRVAEWALPSRALAYGVSMAGRHEHRLADRVGRILHPPPIRREPRWVVTATAMLLLAPLYWLPALGAPMPHASFVMEEFNLLHTEGEGEFGPARLDQLLTLGEASVSARRIIVARFHSD